jgi:hypothetical protein
MGPITSGPPKSKRPENYSLTAVEQIGPNQNHHHYYYTKEFDMTKLPYLSP